jgi:2-C-methyl-D-erythritol 2,4-cyclodiphosphate synthase
MRIGLGDDTHRLAAGGPLCLGGVRIPHDKHFVGHSDADVLLHAITDALLGAAGLPDIGQLFPNTDEANRDRDSAEMLQLAWKRVQELGYELINLDCVVHLQRPKISPHKDAIQIRIAQILDVPQDRIGLKAKTGEGVGAIGNEQAATSLCVALIQNPNSVER